MELQKINKIGKHTRRGRYRFLLELHDDARQGRRLQSAPFHGKIHDWIVAHGSKPSRVTRGRTVEKMMGQGWGESLKAG